MLLTLLLRRYSFRLLVTPVVEAPPGEGEGHDFSRLPNGVKRLQRLEQDRPLLADIARLTDGMTEGPMDKYAPRRAHLLGIFAHDGDADGGDAGCFDDSLNQSHGLIANPSGWRQEN